MEKHPCTSYRIRFKDCDPLGHLYNTRFIDYMLEAREDHIIQHYDMNLEQYLKERGMAWVVTHHEMAYIKEAKRNEIVQIASALIHIDHKSILNEYQMWNEDRTQLKALLHTTFVHINMKEKKSCEHPDDIHAMLQSLQLHIPERDFKLRLNHLLGRS
ncbi:MAG TPA: acyl-CoA thioesterase [Saprospiraceae bacterium]|nr:acyl-CoA thioesterase [Saprospiraceae bacterium]